MSLTSAEGETLLGTTPIGAVVAALALFVSTSPDRGLGPPFQGGNKPAYMALSIRLVAPNSTRSALHDGIKNDSARDKVVKKFELMTVALLPLLVTRRRCFPCHLPYLRTASAISCGVCLVVCTFDLEILRMRLATEKPLALHLLAGFLETSLRGFLLGWT